MPGLANWTLIIGLVLTATSCGGATADECATDSECKGARICEAGECVEPDASTSSDEPSPQNDPQQGQNQPDDVDPTCDPSMSACMEPPDNAEECEWSFDCEDGEECNAGFCEPTGDHEPSCLIGYKEGWGGDSTAQGHTGQDCDLPGDCLSEICIRARNSSGLPQGSWCGNQADCRTPENADDECPDGWSCQQVDREVFEDRPRWLCVPHAYQTCE